MTIKFQSGGTAPFVAYTPLQLNTASSYLRSASKLKESSSDKDSGKLTQKDLLNALKDMDALPSDTKALYNNMIQFIRLSDMEGEDIDSSLLATQFIRLQQGMKVAKFRKEAYENAYKQVIANDGLNEVAITDTGKLVGINESGEIKLIDIDNPEEGYRPVTNSELLKLRAEAFADNDSITRIVSNGIGLEKVNQLIHNAMISLGSIDNSVEGYTKNPQIQAIRELQLRITELQSSGLSDEEKDQKWAELLKEAMSHVQQGNLFKWKDSRGNSNSQIKYALQYIYNALPVNARTLLEVRSGGNGKQMILSLLASGADISDTFEWDMVENEHGVRPGTKESADAQGNIDQYTNIIEGKGESAHSKFQILDADGFSFAVDGKTYPYIQDQTGQIISTGSLANVLQQGLGGLYKGGNYAITFGELPLTEVDTQNILFESDGSIMRVILPTKEVAGKIVPDLDVARNNRELIELINKKGLRDPETVQKIQESGLYRGNSINPAKFLAYIVANAKTTDKVITPNKWAVKFEATLEDEDLMNKHLLSEVDRLDWGEAGMSFLTFAYDDFYKGIVYIPVTENKLAGASMRNENIKESVGLRMLQAYQTGEAWRYMNSTNIDE